jgi:hypothetical protein
MTTLSRETVRDEIVASLASSIAGSGKPVSSVYGYQVGKLDGESPVVLVLSASTARTPRGMGAQSWDNEFSFELHVLVYDGKDANPLTEQQREDKMDEIEAAIAGWMATHQHGTNYRALYYTPEPTTITSVTYLDGNPYRLEVIKVRVEAPDL